MSEQPNHAAPTSTDFEQILHEMDGGVLSGKIGRALSDVALGVTQNNRKGQVTVTFNFKKISDTQVHVDHSVKYVSPTLRGRLIEENTTATPLYVGARGRLTMFPEVQKDLFKAKSDKQDA